MDEMKSALERAMERADRMGTLSPEELQRQNEIKYMPAGEAIAQRFFAHGHTTIMAEQLERLGSEGKLIATRSALNTLINSIDLDNKELTEMALEGINGLHPDSKAISELLQEIMALFGRYAWQKKLWYEENSQEAGKEARNLITAAGISGNAIAEINLENNENWISKSDELRSEFDSILTEMKPSLIKLTGI